MAKNDEVVDAEEVMEVEEVMEEQQLGFKDGVKICWNALKRSKVAKGIAIGTAAVGAAAGGFALAGKIMSGKEIPDDDEGYYAILDHHDDDVTDI